MTNAAPHKTPHQGISQWQRCLEAIWYNGAPGKQCLYPLEAVYKTLARFDRYTKLKQSIEHPVPIIVVGNISVGGTGKTPLVIYLCDLLIRAGYSPGIITRGYGGRATSWPVAVESSSCPADVGDEPVLMAQRTAVPVVAGPNRNEDVAYLLKHHNIDVVVSDDGLQHYRLQRDIEIVVIDQSRGLGNQRCLPAGPLREPASRLQHCDFVVANETVPAAPYSMQLNVQHLRHLNSGDQQPLSDWEGLAIHAVTGIGNPQRFYHVLKAAGLRVIEHSFPDHHPFGVTDITFADGLPILMTEKDAVKCREFATNQHWYVPVSATLNTDFDKQLLAKLAVVAAHKST
ncbi:MAG: tetraacyldisaccharide 4'-kinase [Leucothrix sp.]